MFYLNRAREIQQLRNIILSSRSEFVYLRGRRRVGKSFLLDELCKTTTNCFMVTGSRDATSAVNLQSFAKAWHNFCGDSSLVKLKKTALDWNTVFDTITQYAAQAPNQLTLIFDEIQWLAKQGSGFIGSLKTAWVPWEKSQKINVIVCGSSNKFFSDNVGGEEKILRGLQTAASIWLYPLTLAQVHKQCFPQWKLQEVAIAYMMTGGVPYYLQRLDPSLGFIHAINRAFFSAERNLLEEIDEILSLDFNSQGQETVKRILAVIGQDGSSQKQIILKTGLAESTVFKVVEQLVKYQILFAKAPLFRKKYQYEDIPRYYMKDFFLNFYFQLLAPLSQQIKANQKGLLFPYQVGLSEEGYHIPNFTGKAFELLIRHILDYGHYAPTRLHEKLLLFAPDYEVGDYWDKRTQIDLVVTGQRDRLCRILECKWGNHYQPKWRAELMDKVIPLPEQIQRKNYLIISEPVSSIKRNREVTDSTGEQVVEVSLEDCVEELSFS